MWRMNDNKAQRLHWLLPENGGEVFSEKLGRGRRIGASLFDRTANILSRRQISVLRRDLARVEINIELTIIIRFSEQLPDRSSAV